jgi:hypothetical protein
MLIEETPEKCTSHRSLSQLCYLFHLPERPLPTYRASTTKSVRPTPWQQFKTRRLRLSAMHE